MKRLLYRVKQAWGDLLADIHYWRTGEYDLMEAIARAHAGDEHVGACECHCRTCRRGPR